MGNERTRLPRWLKLLGIGVGGFFALMIGLIVLAAIVAGSSPSDAALKECQKLNEELRAQIAVLERAKPRSAPAEQAPEPKQEEPDGSFGSGTMVVGKDIQPGRYKSAGAVPGAFACYYVRLKGFSGELDDIISNEIARADDGAVIVNIQKTDAGFQSKGCARWEPLEPAK